MARKNTLYSALVLLLGGITPGLWAQNANLVLTGTGLRLVNSGNAVIVLNNADFSNNASAGSFLPGTGTVVFSGSNAATLAGSAATAFHKVQVNKPGTELLLGTDASAGDVFSLSAGDVNLQNATLDLGTTGSISGESYPIGNRLYCADGLGGRIKATRALASGANADIAGLGLDITVSGAAPGSTVIYRGHDRQTSTAFVGAGTSIGRYFDITPTVNSGFTYDLLLRYHDQELSGMTESDFVFYRSPSHGGNTDDWEEWGKDNGIESPGYPFAGIAAHNPSANTVSLTGINTFSRWTVSNSVVNPLPIKLVSFTATCTEQGVKLAWTTATEINNEKFVLHRSADLQNWEYLETVAGAGNSNHMLSYSVSDQRPVTGLSYYRLSQVDYDGASESFAPVSVQCQGEAENRFSVFPNPAYDRFTVAVTVAESQTDARLELCDMNGKTLNVLRTSLAAGSNTFTFERTGMPAGPYYIRLQSGNLTFTPLKLILQ